MTSDFACCCQFKNQINDVFVDLPTFLEQIIGMKTPIACQFMHCPFTGPKMFCACPNILSQPKNLTAFSASSKTFVLVQKSIVLNSNHLFVCHKILGPVKGQGICFLELYICVHANPHVRRLTLTMSAKMHSIESRVGNNGLSNRQKSSCLSGWPASLSKFPTKHELTSVLLLTSNL